LLPSLEKPAEPKTQSGYEVIAFEGPGQGAALKRYGLPWTIYRMGETGESYFRSFTLDGRRDIAWDIDGRGGVVHVLARRASCCV